MSIRQIQSDLLIAKNREKKEKNTGYKTEQKCHILYYHKWNIAKFDGTNRAIAPGG
jgi:hypothetical protein